MTATGLRTHRCGSLTRKDVGTLVRLGGWVHRRRDLGGLVFVDLRDRDGLVQLSCNPAWTPPDVLELAAGLGAETVILAALGAGGFHGRHADNCRQNEQGDWVANHTPNRDASAIYYLNEAFDGGEIVFHQQQLAVKPRCGLLVAFPSGADYTHEVLPVRSGIRYTMAIWFTKQQRLALANFPLGTSTTAPDIRERGTTTA